MKNRLLLYPGQFSPVTCSEIRYAKWWNQSLDGEVVFLPLEEDNNASFEDRLQMVMASIDKEGGKITASDFFVGKTVLELVKKASSYDLYVLEDFDNKNLVQAFLKAGVQKSHICTSNDESSPMSSFSFRSREKDNRSLKTIDLNGEVIHYIHEKKLFYIDKVASFLSDKRLAHSESVATLCYSIAISNQFDNPGKAYIAGLLHDIGKYVDSRQAISLMKRRYDEFLSYPEWAYHQFVGAVLAKKEFHIEDKEIIDAICYHCTGKPAMSPLGEILYSADKIDPLRGWDSNLYIQECKRNYHKGFLEVLKANRLYLESKTKGHESECPLSSDCYRFYL